MLSEKWSALIFALLLTTALVLATTVSCGDDDDDDNNNDTENDDDDDDTDDNDDNLTDDDTTDDDDDTIVTLIWQDPPNTDEMKWQQAIDYCETLTFDSHDDWRLPTISELRSLISGCESTTTGGACGVTDDCLASTCRSDVCNGCDHLAGPGLGGAYWPEGMSGDIATYWSSSPVTDVQTFGWYVMFTCANVGNFVDDNDYVYALVRCVRSSE